VGAEALLVEGTGQERQEIDAYQVLRFEGCPEQYRSYVLARWKRGLRYGNDYFRLIKPEAFYAAYELYLTNLLPEATCRFAVLASDHDVCLGYSVTRGSVLDFVHVHKDYRRRGIGKRLVPAGIDTISHLTKTALTIWGSKYPGWSFNPYA
jgi:ribosomal protein S18 acetylase RimI-like enzyme